MKAVILMFDSLNRRLLEPYGGRLETPNFSRLAERAAVFEQSYCCSMPCMPARRDFHTARPGFLHRGWGPLEPFDDSVPAILRDQGIYTHLCSDHYHYWEEGGANYHARYSSWEAFRGQEGDPWKGHVAVPRIPECGARNACIDHRLVRQDWVNRPYMDTEETHSQTRTVDAGIAFMETNAADDNWLLQIECFDPHEPFFAAGRFLGTEGSSGSAEGGAVADWPEVGRHDYPESVREELKRTNAALHRMCDASLGRVMDTMDRLGLWEDTLFVVWTDHGVLLGERGYWLKNVMPLYDEICHTPFFIHDPRTPSSGTRRQALVQPAVDLGPTLLEFFGLDPTPDMFGHDLSATIREDKPVRSTAVFGYFGKHVNITDGRHVYMRGRDADAPPIRQYTLMPSHMANPFGLDEVRSAQWSDAFSFSKGCPLLSFAGGPPDAFCTRNLLFDLEADPLQVSPVDNPAEEERLCAELLAFMRSCDAPPGQYTSLGLPVPTA